MNRIPLLLSIVALLSADVQAAQPQGPRFTAKLHAAHETIEPGGETELAVELTVEADWHIYHPITIGSGVPTTIELELPEGATIGELRFPTPALEVYRGIEYLALEGRVVALTTLKLAADFDTGPLTITAQVRALACKELCVPVAAEASLTLTVSEEPPAAANEELFEQARGALPPLLAKAEYIVGSRVLVSHTQVPVGARATLAVVIRVKPHHHVLDRNPGVEGLIPSRLFVESRPGVKFDPDRQIWPKPRIHEVPGVGTAREQAGEFVIQAPFEINDVKFEPGPVRLRMLFQYQCCEDNGPCFMPMMAAGLFEFEAAGAGAAAVKNDDPIFEKLAAQAASTGDQGDFDGTAAAASGRETPSLLYVFFLAFLGGVILNIMPCVLPVISLKIFGFMQQAGDDPGRVFRMGLVYAGGIMASFLALAVAMVAAGKAWGGLMQEPGFLIGLGAVVFAFSLSLLGVFEIQLPGFAMSVAGEASTKEGYGGAFLNGILATLLATPCVGPFLGSAVGLLAKLPPIAAGTGIMIVGVGLATPYVLLTAFPGWLRFLPKPGPWMVTFKQVVGFILVAVVIWLMSILIEMVSHAVILGVLGLLCAVGVGCWLLGKITLSDSAKRATTIWLAALALMFGGGWTSFRLFEGSSIIPWQAWEPGIAERLASEGYTVYVDYTATWCLTCQGNKKLVLERSRVATEFEKLGVYPIKADFTTYDKRMQNELNKHGRNGVPLNIVVPADRPTEPIVLPEILTTRIVQDALQKAGPSREKPDFWSQKR